MGQSFDLQDHRVPVDDAEGVTPPDAPDRRFRDRESENAQIGAHRAELEVLRRQMTELDSIPTTEIMLRLSSTAARLREIISDLWDMRSPAAAHLRARHAEPLMKDLDFHFRTHSRRLSDLELDWKMAGGQ